MLHSDSTLNGSSGKSDALYPDFSIALARTCSVPQGHGLLALGQCQQALTAQGPYDELVQANELFGTHTVGRWYSPVLRLFHSTH